jgi:hypothetical protein
MRIVLKVISSNEYCDGGCEFALVDLTPELATLALSRIAALREQQTLDPNIEGTHYWAYFVARYFSPFATSEIDDKEVDGISFRMGEMLDQLQIEEKEVVLVPEIFQVPAGLIAAVECEKMTVRLDAIAFSAIPKHASFFVQTVEVPITMLEAALPTSYSTPPT